MKKMKYFDIILLVVVTIIITVYIVIFNENPRFFFGTYINQIECNILGILSITYTIVFLLQTTTNTKIQESIDSSNNLSEEISQIVKKSDEIIQELHSYERKRELISLFITI